MRLILTATALLAFAGLANADDYCRPKHRLFGGCKHGCGHGGFGHGHGGHALFGKLHGHIGAPSIGWWGVRNEPPNPYIYWSRYNRSPRDFFMVDP